MGNASYVEATGGSGSIDPKQTTIVSVFVAKEGGAWKVDDLTFRAG